MPESVSSVTVKRISTSTTSFPILRADLRWFQRIFSCCVRDTIWRRETGCSSAGFAVTPPRSHSVALLTAEPPRSLLPLGMTSRHAPVGAGRRDLWQVAAATCPTNNSVCALETLGCGWGSFDSTQGKQHPRPTALKSNDCIHHLPQMNADIGRLNFSAD